MSKVTVIYMGASDVSKQNQRIEVSDGATVRDALAKAGVPTDNVLVNVNRVKGSLDQVVGNSDMITVTQTNLKGAAEALLTFDDIRNWGKGEAVVTGDVVAEAMKEVAEEGAKAHKAIVKEVLGLAKASAASVNKAVADAEKQLKAAQESAAEFNYAYDQLKSGNIFSLLGFASLKEQAPHYCARMGCEVPANDSDVWATSAPKA